MEISSLITLVYVAMENNVCYFSILCRTHVSFQTSLTYFVTRVTKNLISWIPQRDSNYWSAMETRTREFGIGNRILTLCSEKFQNWNLFYIRQKFALSGTKTFLIHINYKPYNSRNLILCTNWKKQRAKNKIKQSIYIISQIIVKSKRENN